MSAVYYDKNLRYPHRLPEVVDKDSKTFLDIVYIPSTWAANTVYKAGMVIIPTAFKGIAYTVTATGKSMATEPTWLHAVGDTLVSGATFVGIDYFDAIDLDPALTVTTSTFTASNGVTLTLPTNTTGATRVFISTIPSGITDFTITNHTVWSNAEEKDFSVLMIVSEK